MKRSVDFYISELLYIHDCVIIPGFGGFVLYVGGTGDIKVEFASAPPNQTVVVQSIPAGTTLSMLVRKVYTTDSATTATEMVALY